MSFLYCTADRIGAKSGGGLVTAQESQAMQELGPTRIWGRTETKLEADWSNGPWGPDEWLCGDGLPGPVTPYRLSHFYAGTFTKTIERLKAVGSKITYTAAAHSIEVSKREHEKLGFAYNYPHLTNPDLWKRYVGGYLAADVLICPSRHSANVMYCFGANNKIEIIPHGCALPEQLVPYPKRFVLGYMGAISPDKGIVYLLEAWNKLAWKDALLVIAGRDSISQFMYGLLEQFGGGNVCLSGWIEDVADFYNSLSAYCQPSCTEGFGIEVLEAYAHGRPVVCSRGAGAADLVPEAWTFEAGNVEDLMAKLELAREQCGLYKEVEGNWPDFWQGKARPYVWEEVRRRYVGLWKELLK